MQRLFLNVNLESWPLKIYLIVKFIFLLLLPAIFACSAVEFLVDLGASVVEVSLPEIEEVRVAHVICILSEMRDFLQSDFNNQFEQMVNGGWGGHCINWYF